MVQMSFKVQWMSLVINIVLNAFTYYLVVIKQENEGRQKSVGLKTSEHIYQTIDQ